MMFRYRSKLLSAGLLGCVLMLWGCDRPQLQTPLSSFTPSEFTPGEYTVITAAIQRATTPPSIIDRILQHEREGYPKNEVSKVPLLSVQLVNDLHRQNGKVQICKNSSTKPYVLDYFSIIYQLGPQEYLIEQLCDVSTYNRQFGYLIYRPSSPLAQVAMQKFPKEAYERTERGYRFKGKGLNQTELTIPDGEVIPLNFDHYYLDESGKRVHSVRDVVSGKRLYEPKTRTLWVWSKYRGMGDCGSFDRYQLRNSKFVLLEAREQKCCSTEEECNAPGYRRPPEKYPLIYP